VLCLLKVLETDRREVWSVKISIAKAADKGVRPSIAFRLPRSYNERRRDILVKLTRARVAAAVARRLADEQRLGVP